MDIAGVIIISLIACIAVILVVGMCTCFFCAKKSSSEHRKRFTAEKRQKPKKHVYFTRTSGNPDDYFCTRLDMNSIAWTPAYHYSDFSNCGTISYDTSCAYNTSTTNDNSCTYNTSSTNDSSCTSTCDTSTCD